MSQNFLLNETVFDLMFGYGTVTQTDSAACTVTFASGARHSFTQNGICSFGLHRTLFIRRPLIIDTKLPPVIEELIIDTSKKYKALI